jgi:two-component system vancomycin resistance associated response regulator VraR
VRSESTALTKRESEILEAFLENGCSNDDLAARFNISAETLKIHMQHIYNKTGYSSRTELAVNELHKRYARAVAA